MDQANLQGTLVEGLYIKPKSLVVSSTVLAGPTLISADTVHFRHAYFQGRAADGTPNVGAVNIGILSAVGQQPLPVASNKEFQLSAPGNLKYSFSDFYFIVASDGDSLVIWYN